MAAVFAGPLLAVTLLAAPAHADYGTFDYNEYLSVCTDGMNFTSGCTRGSYQSEVEGTGDRGCSCGGHSVDTWTANGRAWKRVTYANTAGQAPQDAVLIDYKKLDNGKWAVGGKVWNPGGAYTD